MSDAAKEYGQDVAHEKISATVPIAEAGYVYIYLSNEETSPVEVYFDEMKVTQVKSPVVSVSDYMPFGLSFNEYTREQSVHQDYKYNGKELQDELNLGWLDYSSRFYDPGIARWHSLDAMSESYFSYSPYNYVRNNPILRIDPSGKWDITVHLYNDREQYGYGVAVVTDRSGNEVFRFDVRAEGTGGRDRMQTNSDTPLGVYDIPYNDPNKPTWITGGDRAAYGPNARLFMDPESGEIVDSGRDQIRIHGGRQEVYDQKTNTWTPVTNPLLKKTHGCLRAYDTDMATLKQIVDDLEANDANENPGAVTVVDDLEKETRPENDGSSVQVIVTYRVPANEIQLWQDFIRGLLSSNN